MLERGVTFTPAPVLGIIGAWEVGSELEVVFSIVPQDPGFDRDLFLKFYDGLVMKTTIVA